MNRIEFANSIDIVSKTEIDKVIYLAFFDLKFNQKNTFAISDIIVWFDELHLSSPNISRLKSNIAKSKSIILTPSKNSYKIHARTVKKLEEELKINSQNKIGSLEYVNSTRILELKEIKSTEFDLTKLVKFCEELNSNYQNKNYLSVVMLVRAIIDHVPPIFHVSKFSEIANNYSGTKSFKDSMQSLSNSLRKIADNYLHTQIRKNEVLPNSTQVDYSNDVDLLLSEIIRLLKQN